MLAEFKYGLEPQESFSNVFGDQAIPRSAFYYLKKDFFPYVYWNYMVREFILSYSSVPLTLLSLGQGHLVRLEGLQPPHLRPVNASCCSQTINVTVCLLMGLLAQAVKL